jgi:hypothetical protein
VDSGFCAKDNVESPLDKGCRHPDDYCQYRQSCMIHFLDQEKRRDKKGSKDGDNDTR